MKATLAAEASVITRANIKQLNKKRLQAKNAKERSEIDCSIEKQKSDWWENNKHLFERK